MTQRSDFASGRKAFPFWKRGFVAKPGWLSTARAERKDACIASLHNNTRHPLKKYYVRSSGQKRNNLIFQSIFTPYRRDRMVGWLDLGLKATIQELSARVSGLGFLVAWDFQ
jgi:hypothetical protein